MGINYEIRKFRDSIINLSNQSELPVEIKRLCFLEIINHLERLAESQIEKEAIEYQNNQEHKPEEGIQNGD